jgi:hypothetical protein
MPMMRCLDMAIYLPDLPQPAKILNRLIGLGSHYAYSPFNQHEIVTQKSCWSGQHGGVQAAYSPVVVSQSVSQNSQRTQEPTRKTVRGLHANLKFQESIKE